MDAAPPAREATPRDDRAGWIAAGVLALAAFVYLRFRYPEAPATDDTFFDFLRARDCVTTRRCRGAVASVGGLEQGALWVQLLATVLSWNGGSHGVVLITQSLIAIAVGVLFLTAYRHCGTIGAWVSGALGLELFLRWIPSPGLWNPTLMPLPLAMLFFCLLEVATSGGLGWCVGAAIAQYLVIEAHLIGLLLLPITLATTLAFAQRPWAAIAQQVGTMIALGFALSPDAVVIGIERLPPVVPLGIAVPGAVIALVALLKLRPWLLGLAPTTRGLLVPVLSLFVVVLALSIGSRSLPWQAQERYLLPLVPGITLLIAYLVSAPRLRARIPKAIPWAIGVVSAVAIVAAGHPLLYQPAGKCGSSRQPNYTLEEAEALGRALLAEGATHESLRQGLRGPDQATILDGLALVTPATATSSADAIRPLQVLRVCRDEVPTPLPSGWRALPISERAVALIGERPSWLRKNAFSVCYESLERPAKNCLTTASSAWQVHERRGYYSPPSPLTGEFYEFTRTWNAEQPGRFRATFEYPVERSSADSWHVVDFTSETLAPSPWEISGVTGEQVILRREGDEQTLRVSRIYSVPDSMPYPWLPEFDETSEDEQVIRALIDEQGSRGAR